MAREYKRKDFTKVNCPICGKEMYAKDVRGREKTTCSVKCNAQKAVIVNQQRELENRMRKLPDIKKKVEGIDEGFGYWLSGFTDGEGSFVIAKDTRGKFINFRYQITLRYDDVEILNEIQRELGFGNVRIRKPRVVKGIDGTDIDIKKQASFSIEDMEGAYFIKLLFDKFPLRAKKKKEFEVWGRGIELKYFNIWEECKSEVWGLFEEIKEVREYD